MGQSFINKIEQIILEHIEDEKFGVNELAFESGLSKSQLWRKVKTSTGKSTNEFIREIRLKEAARLVLENEHTASEISYMTGFGSPSYFNKCFHDHYGVTPGDYNKYKEESSKQDVKDPESEKTTKFRLSKKVLVILLFILAVVVGYLSFNNSGPQHQSIAVLPFLDLSENKNMEYLTDGLTEQLISELSGQNDLRVISRTSAMSYKDEKKLSSEIANELGVDYLIEGSVLYGSEGIKVMVQLIDPLPKEKNIWQNSYNRKFKDILTLCKAISTEITEEINPVQVPEEKGKTRYVVNPEAYELYLKGRHLWNQKNTESVKRSIEYLKKSIELDSAYAPAYVILAEDYILMNKFIRNNEEKPAFRKKSRVAIQKALELDPNLAEAYITMGNLIGKFDWNWEEMRKMLEKGLQLDPNNSYGHTLLSKYYLIKNEYSKALEEALLAEKLDPLNIKSGWFVGENYFYSGDYHKSLQQYEKILELYPDYGFTWESAGQVQVMLGQKEAAKSSFAKFLKVMGNNYMEEIFTEKPFDEAVDIWLEGATKEEELYCSNPPVIAQAHIFVNKKEGALKYLNIAYKYRNEDLPMYLIRPYFYTLYDDPQFKDLVKKTGVILPKIHLEYELKD